MNVHKAVISLIQLIFSAQTAILHARAAVDLPKMNAHLVLVFLNTFGNLPEHAPKYVPMVVMFLISNPFYVQLVIQAAKLALDLLPQLAHHVIVPAQLTENMLNPSLLVFQLALQKCLMTKMSAKAVIPLA